MTTMRVKFVQLKISVLSKEIMKCTENQQRASAEK